MNPLGNIDEQTTEDNILDGIEGREFVTESQITQTENNGCHQKIPLVKILFNQSKAENLRRTSSFMLRSKNDEGGNLT